MYTFFYYNIYQKFMFNFFDVYINIFSQIFSRNIL